MLAGCCCGGLDDVGWLQSDAPALKAEHRQHGNDGGCVFHNCCCASDAVCSAGVVVVVGDAVDAHNLDVAVVDGG